MTDISTFHRGQPHAPAISLKWLLFRLGGDRALGPRRFGMAALLATVSATAIGIQIPKLALPELMVMFGAIVMLLALVIRPGLFLPLLYGLALTWNSGLVTWAPLVHVGPINGNDVLLGLLVVVSVPAYQRQRRNLESPWLRRLEFAWATLVVLIAIDSARSKADTVAEWIDNLHVVEGFIFFFLSLAALSSTRRFTCFAIVAILIAAAGTVVTVAQSLHGLDNITTSPFYDTGSWDGNKQMVGSIARVNLPVSDWVTFVVLIMSALSLLRFRWWYVLAAGFLSVTIVVDFARSLWLAVAAALVVQVCVLLSIGRLGVGRALRILAIPGALAITFNAAPSVGLQGLGDAVLGRLDEGAYALATGSGTWGQRQNGSADVYRFWETNIPNMLLGVGTSYWKAFGYYVDLGLPLALLSVGLVGLAVEAYLAVVCCLAAFHTVRRAAVQGSVIPIVLAVGVISELVVIVVYQEWVSPRAFAILGFSVACMIVTGAGPSPIHASIAHRRTGALGGVRPVHSHIAKR